MDWGSVAGLVLALAGILVGQALEGGRLSSLVQPASFMIVMFGTLGAVLLQSKLSDFKRAVRKLPLVFIAQVDDRNELLSRATLWSMVARKRGLISLESFLEDERDPFFYKGLRLLIDGVSIETIKEICSNELDQYEALERSAIKIWDSAGGYAPTLGILGAVVGLIHVMENLSEPSMLGSGIAVAFVATIYGVGVANLVFIPIANKLKVLSQAQIVKREMFVEALSCIYNRENSMLVAERLSTYLV
jgi:chemotaxis protein MotA